jgi:hypothetical protein
MVDMNLPEGRRCKGAPLRLNGKKWGNLGKGSEAQCKQMCINEPACKYLVYLPSKSTCSAFGKCKKTKYQPKGFTNWEKV